MRHTSWFLELLGKAVEGREALAAGRTSFATLPTQQETERCTTGRPVRLIALRDLAPLPRTRHA